MKIESIKNIYHELLSEFPTTLKKASEDTNKPAADRYMTMSEIDVVNFDRFKNKFVKNMALAYAPLSCDALYMTAQDEFFMIEFKNGEIEAKKNYEIKVKIFESLLMLCEKLSKTMVLRYIEWVKKCCKLTIKMVAKKTALCAYR